MELIVGVIVRAHGVRGEVAVEIRTDDPEARFAPGSVLHVEPKGQLTVDTARRHQGRLLVRFVEIPDRAAAEEWRGRELHVDVPDDAVKGESDEYYDQQLVGLIVVTGEGEVVGRIAEVRHHPAQDLLVVRTASGDVLVPFVPAIVPTVDLPRGRVVVTPPPGLLKSSDVEIAE